LIFRLGNFLVISGFSDFKAYLRLLFSKNWWLLLEKLLLTFLDSFFVRLRKIAFIIPRNEGFIFIVGVALDLIEPLFLLDFFLSLNSLFFFDVNFLKFGRFLLALLILNLWLILGFFLCRLFFLNDRLASLIFRGLLSFNS
jgi:hypothetical protein